MIEESRVLVDERLEGVRARPILVDSYFGQDASTRLFDEMDYQRASQAYIWSTPLVSATTWRDELQAKFEVKSRRNCQGPQFTSRTSTANGAAPHHVTFVLGEAFCHSATRARA